MSFDFKKFADGIEAGLKGNCFGYAFVVSYKDDWKEKRAAGKARTKHNAPELAMSTDVPFHIASVSKAITAAALLKLLNQRGDVGIKSAFHPWLPNHWHVDQTLREITFEQLLTHTSGFRFSGTVDYHDLKHDMATGINPPNVGVYNYENTNFAIMRMLIPRLANYDIVQSSNGGSNFDVIQAEIFSNFYIDYVQKHLFEKAGLSKITCMAMPYISGVCYHFPEKGHAGTDFGDQSHVAGSKGWVMSAAQMAKFFRQLHYTENILPAWLSLQMRKDLLGYDRLGKTGDGVDFYWKNGWFPGSQNAGELNTLTIDYGNDVQVALIINSELTGGKGMVGIINDAYDAAYQMTKISVDDIKKSDWASK